MTGRGTGIDETPDTLLHLFRELAGDEISSPGPGGRIGARRRGEQRARLQAATVLATDRGGYAALRVADIIGLAGISRATFYRHFANKGECFEATVRALLGGAARQMRRALEPGPPEERAREALAALLALCAEQPAAARFCLIEAYAAGPQGTAPVEEALGQACEVARAALRRLPLHGEARPTRDGR